MRKANGAYCRRILALNAACCCVSAIISRPGAKWRVPRMASLDDVKIALDVNDVAGVAVLTIGQRYSKAWRRVGAAIERTDLPLLGDDRSRGIYLVSYTGVVDGTRAIDGVPARAKPLELHLLAKGNRTLVTVHPNVAGDDVSYALAHQVLKRVLMAYEVGDVVSR